MNISCRGVLYYLVLNVIKTEFYSVMIWIVKNRFGEDSGGKQENHGTESDGGGLLTQVR